MTWPFGALIPHRYGAILADPPWTFQSYSAARTMPHRCIADHYQTMSFEELAALSVGQLAARDAALFLWVVDSHLDQAFTLMPIWGFEFKTRAFTWDKGHYGFGYWTRKQTEICLLATRGNPRRKSGGVAELMRAPRRENSRKPDEIYAAIEQLVPGPYVELFARQQRRGWAAWGNETTKFNALQRTP